MTYDTKRETVQAVSDQADGQAAGTFGIAALIRYRTVAAWRGDDGSGQCDVPLPNADFVAIAGGGLHSLGLCVPSMVAVREPRPADALGPQTSRYARTRSDRPRRSSSGPGNLDP